MSANDRQVGGSHYKNGGEEHWDRVDRLGLDYFQGQITKYVERWKLKNGIQDLEKASHFLDKYIELQKAKLESEKESARCKWCVTPSKCVSQCQYYQKGSSSFELLPEQEQEALSIYDAHPTSAPMRRCAESPVEPATGTALGAGGPGDPLPARG